MAEALVSRCRTCRSRLRQTCSGIGEVDDLMRGVARPRCLRLCRSDLARPPRHGPGAVAGEALPDRCPQATRDRQPRAAGPGCPARPVSATTLPQHISKSEELTAVRLLVGHQPDLHGTADAWCPRGDFGGTHAAYSESGSWAVWRPGSRLGFRRMPGRQSGWKE